MKRFVDILIKSGDCSKSNLTQSCGIPLDCFYSEVYLLGFHVQAKLLDDHFEKSDFASIPNISEYDF
jgi:hypothetical protein